MLRKDIFSNQWPTSKNCIADIIGPLTLHSLPLSLFLRPTATCSKPSRLPLSSSLLPKIPSSYKKYIKNNKNYPQIFFCKTKKFLTSALFPQISLTLTLTMGRNLLPFLLLLLLCLLSVPTSSAVSSIGINYGQVADNLPSPAAVLPLLRSINAGRVKLYDADPRVLKAFAGTDIEFVVGLPDRLLPSVRSPAAALSWVSSNIKPYLPKTKIAAVTIGNEVLSSNNTAFIQSLVPAMISIRSALASLGVDEQVAVTTAHSLNVLSVSYPPSAGAFRKDLLPYVVPLLTFLNKTGAPFLINAYPFFAYKADPKRISLDYVLFESGRDSDSAVLDPGSGLKYGNMLHAQVDAVRSAIAAAGGGKGIEVRVSETGWPSRGDEDEVGATAENARKYNGNLMKMVASGKGTPMSPQSPLHVYVFALFNENLKTGPASERHYGLFNPDMSPAYDLGIKPVVAGNSSGNGADSPMQSAGGGGSGSSSTGFYTISTAPDMRGVAAVGVAMAVGAVLLVA